MTVTTYDRWAVASLGTFPLMESNGSALLRVVTNIDPTAEVWVSLGGTASEGGSGCSLIPAGRSFYTTYTGQINGWLRPNYTAPAYNCSSDHNAGSGQMLPTDGLVYVNEGWTSTEIANFPTNFPGALRLLTLAGSGATSPGGGFTPGPLDFTANILDCEQTGWTAGTAHTATSGSGTAASALTSISAASASGWTAPGYFSVACSGGNAYYYATTLTSLTLSGLTQLSGNPAWTVNSSATITQVTPQNAIPAFGRGANVCTPSDVPLWATTVSNNGHVPIVYYSFGVTLSSITTALASASYSGFPILYWYGNEIPQTQPAQLYTNASPNNLANQVGMVQWKAQGIVNRQTVAFTAVTSGTTLSGTFTACLGGSLLTLKVYVANASTDPNIQPPDASWNFVDKIEAIGSSVNGWIYVFDKLGAWGGEAALTVTWTGATTNATAIFEEWSGWTGAITRDLSGTNNSAGASGAFVELVSAGGGSTQAFVGGATAELVTSAIGFNNTVTSPSATWGASDAMTVTSTPSGAIVLASGYYLGAPDLSGAAENYVLWNWTTARNYGGVLVSYYDAGNLPDSTSGAFQWNTLNSSLLTVAETT